MELSTKQLEKARFWFKTAATVVFFFVFGGIPWILLFHVTPLDVLLFFGVEISIVVLCMARGFWILKKG